jgi:hypothetical protein
MNEELEREACIDLRDLLRMWLAEFGDKTMDRTLTQRTRRALSTPPLEVQIQRGEV